LRRVHTLIALSASTVLFAGCASDSGEPESESDADGSRPSASPSPSPSDAQTFSEEIVDVEDLRRFCGYREGEVYDGAADYAGGGPHTMVVTVSEEETNLDGKFEMQEDEPFSDWLPDEPTDAELLGCVEGVPGDTRIDTCEYTELGTLALNDLTLPLYEQTFRVTVYELGTANVVAETTIEPEQPSCPTTIENLEVGDVEAVPDKVYPRAPMSVVSDYLADIANSPAPD
jgi:hypothetical protein